MSESMRKGTRLRVGGMVVVCFGAGLAVGILWPRGAGKGIGEDAGGVSSGRPGISAMVVPSVADEDAHGIYARLKGAGREAFVRELERLPEWDGYSPSVRAKWMALAMRWVLEDAGPMKFAKIFQNVWAKQDLAGASAFSARLAASGHEVSWWMKGSCEAARREADPEGILKGLPTDDYYERRKDIAEAIARLATAEPGKAAAFLAEMGDCQERRTSVVELGRKWARHDAAAAKSWALGVEDEWERYLALDAVVSELAKSDLAAAMASYRELIDMGAEPVITNVDPTLESHERIAAALARKDPHAALQWMTVDAAATRRAILALPEGLRAEAGAEALEQTGRFKSVAEAIAFAREANVMVLGEEFTEWVGVRNDVRVAADYLASAGGDALPAIMARWASRWPAEAAAWSATLTDGTLRARLVDPLVNEWVRNDALAASEWVAGLEEGPVREAGARVVESGAVICFRLGAQPRRSRRTRMACAGCLPELVSTPDIWRACSD